MNDDGRPFEDQIEAMLISGAPSEDVVQLWALALISQSKERPVDWKRVNKSVESFYQKPKYFYPLRDRMYVASEKLRKRLASGSQASVGSE